jgi:hypothetical protein
MVALSPYQFRYCSGVTANIDNRGVALMDSTLKLDRGYIEIAARLGRQKGRSGVSARAKKGRPAVPSGGQLHVPEYAF